MHIQSQFSCFIIGEGTLTIKCCELLLAENHHIFGVISPDALISNWTKAKNIPHIQPTDNLIAFLSQQPFDYLFSIANNFVLPKEILELPRHYAINYQDAPLPRYAGANAVSWALMHQERTHGVTWHVMSDIAERDKILKQFYIDIGDDETAFSLNVKCYEAAIHSFAQLIDDLSSGQALGSKSTLDERTYFPRSKRLSAGGVLLFNRCAHDIDANLRALDFGPYPNPLGLMKLVIGSDLLIVPKLDVTNSVSKSPPGTVTTIEPNLLKVSTTSYDVALYQVITIDGQTLSIPDLVARFGLKIGYQFQDIEPDTARCIEAFDALVAEHEAFWVERLATLQPITIPYTEQKASHLRQKCYKRVKVPVPDEIPTFLQEHYQACNWGDFLFAAFAAYLARIGGTGCFDIGFRDYELRQELVGLENFFAFHVPFRVDIDCEQSFKEVFSAFREQMELTKLHKTYARDVVPRYPALRSFSEMDYEQMFPVLVERVEKLDDYQAEFGSELTLIVPSDGKECCWIYNMDALDGESIARMLDQFTTFMQGIVTDPSQPVAYLPLLSEPERRKILVEWNETQLDYPKECIHKLFEAQVERTPNAVAVIFENEQLTYRELNDRANQLAHYLQAQGVGPEVLVGLCMERSLEVVVGFLGILKAGGAYVPLDPAYPKERLAFMLEDAQVPILLTQKRLEECLPQNKARLVCLDTDWQSIAQQIGTNPVSGVRAENLVYVVYTSGSTGKPKGILMEHRSLCNLIEAMVRTLNVGTDSRILQLMSLSFDPSILEIFAALRTGATLCLARQDSLLPVLPLSQLLRDQAITTAIFPPSVLALLPEEELSGLETVITGAEPFSAELVARWAPGRHFFNIYAPSEVAIVATTTLCTDGNRKPPIGLPIANTEIYLLDSHLQPVPIGIPGEIYIGGVGLARGYLNRPELTAEKFIPNPFSAEPGARLYKTGDLARYLPDGNIEFLGRIDNQVKIRGFRIELGEIEAVLRQHPSVREALVTVREDVPNDKRLVAYIIPNQKWTPTIYELQRFLQQKLPKYMVASTFVFLEALPLTPNGKVDHRALPVPDQSQLNREETFVAPHTYVEQQLANIWAQVLGLEQIGIYDNLFDLGGNSVHVIQIISQVREFFQVELPLRNWFELPTVADLAKRIEGMVQNRSTLERGDGETSEMGRHRTPV
ncbi:MAG: amino acid adenylation domain-containing protein [Xenococcaceae cyanobacterium]